MATILGTIDEAVVTALANNASLKALRESLRGGSAGQGENMTTGPVPELDTETGRYGVQERELPAIFNGASVLKPLETGAVEYEVVTIAVLPHLVAGSELSDDDFEEFGERLLVALSVDDPMNNQSLSSLLLASSSAGAAVHWQVTQIVLTGSDSQPRVEAQTLFSIPASTMLGITQGIVEGT